MHCPACGVAVVEDSKFCYKCGEPVARDEGEGAPSGADRLRQAAARKQQGSVGQDERELWAGNYSARAMIGNWVGASVFTVASFVGCWFWWPSAVWWLALLGLILGVWLYQLALLGYRRLSVRYRLTSQRFVHESGVVSRVIDRVELLDIDDIRVEQGPIDRLMGTGTLRISSSDRTHPDLKLPGIDRIKEVAVIFDDARLIERRRRGLHIEQI